MWRSRGPVQRGRRRWLGPSPAAARHAGSHPSPPSHWRVLQRQSHRGAAGCDCSLGAAPCPAAEDLPVGVPESSRGVGLETQVVVLALVVDPLKAPTKASGIFLGHGFGFISHAPRWYHHNSIPLFLISEGNHAKHSEGDIYSTMCISLDTQWREGFDR